MESPDSVSLPYRRKRFKFFRRRQRWARLPIQWMIKENTFRHKVEVVKDMWRLSAPQKNWIAPVVQKGVIDLQVFSLGIAKEGCFHPSVKVYNEKTDPITWAETRLEVKIIFVESVVGLCFVKLIESRFTSAALYHLKKYIYKTTDFFFTQL